MTTPLLKGESPMAASTEPVAITVTKRVIFYRGQLRPFRDHYYCTGPDGRRFDNSSLVELRGRLRHYYGKVEIVKAWEGR